VTVASAVKPSAVIAPLSNAARMRAAMPAAPGQLTKQPAKSGTILGLPQWIVILGGLLLLGGVWYFVRPRARRNGGRAWASRSPF
jgi:hypothetical protein